MAKEVKTTIKLEIPGGQANPSPPIGPALGQHGLNIAEFCQKFNEVTQDKQGETIPVEITVYDDQSYDFKLKTPPVSFLLKKAANVEKGSSKPHKSKAGKITSQQLNEIAERKMEDLNTSNLEKAKKIVKGTGKSMGIEVK